jgi:hypothetical protein
LICDGNVNIVINHNPITKIQTFRDTKADVRETDKITCNFGLGNISPTINKVQVMGVQGGQWIGEEAHFQ